MKHADPGNNALRADFVHGAQCAGPERDALRVHLDHNATTALRPEVRELWLAKQDELGGNPSSVHRAGRRARHVLDEARERIAAALCVHEDEIVFTSGGTESNNLARCSAACARSDARRVW